MSKTGRYSEYGIHTPDDERALRAWESELTRLGVTHTEKVAIRQAYGDAVRRGLSGAAAKDFIVEKCANVFPPDMVQGLLRDAYEPMVQHGYEAFEPPRPSVDEDAATIRDAQDLMRRDQEGYRRDGDLQDRYFEALERQAEMAQVRDDGAADRQRATGRTTAAPSADEQRFNELKAMVGAPNGSAAYHKYWTSPELQNEFGTLAVRMSAAPTEPAGGFNTSSPAGDARRVQEIQTMLRTPDGLREYWRTPALQTEFGQVLERTAGATSSGDGGGAPPAAPGGAGNGD